MMKVSVIAPMYCSKSVLGPSVNALLRQGLEDMEIILVDDCSPDGTFEYARELYRDNEKVRVLQMEENGGPGLARNRGIEEAKGEYICFCDIDDCYRDGAIKTMYEEAVRFQADVYATTEIYLTVVESLPDDLSSIPLPSRMKTFSGMGLCRPRLRWMRKRLTSRETSGAGWMAG